MASDVILKEKRKIVSEIVNKINDSNSVIFVDYRGLTVGEVTELRKQLRESGTDFKVYKNTFLKRAVDELNFDLGDNLVGPSAIALSKNVVEPAKILSNYAKLHNVLKIKIGIIEKEVSGLDVIKNLATIPSREGLLTMLAGGMIGTIKDLSISLNLYSEQLNVELKPKEEPRKKLEENKDKKSKEE